MHHIKIMRKNSEISFIQDELDIDKDSVLSSGSAS